MLIDPKHRLPHCAPNAGRNDSGFGAFGIGSPLILLLVSWLGVSTMTHAVEPITFSTHRINPQSEFAACAVFDVDRDGKLDIYCGGFWYRGPNWEKIKTRDVPKIRGRFDDYSNLPLDVDRDGWTDVISVNYRSRSIFVSRNPRSRRGEWKTTLVDQPGASETGRLFDIDGDGQLDLLPNGTKFAAWYKLLPGMSAQWQRHELPIEIAGHGIGFGDINGDGRGDIITANGWFEAPEKVTEGRWVHRNEFKLPRDCSIPILVSDFDRDGDQDLFFGRGHDIGVYWCEQTQSNGKRNWTLRAVDTTWSSAHSLVLADIDNDGQQDVVAGKRFWGHDGKDPGEWDPLVVYLYRFGHGVWHRTRLSDVDGAGFDLDPACADVDDDGDLDIVGATRKGLFLLENRLQQGKPTLVRASETPQYSPSMSILVDERAGRRTRISSTVEWGVKRQKLLRNFERVMGTLPGPDARVPLAVSFDGEEQADGYKRFRISYQAERGDRVPAYLLIPDGGGPNVKRSGVLCLHPTHRLGKAQVCGLGGNPSRFYAHELAQRGFVCLVPDYPSFGEYHYDFQDASHRRQYASGSMKAIWNNIRAIDLLESLPEVERDKIGCVGHSLGGHNGLFTAAFDQRIRAVVTSCGFTCFARYYGGDLKGWTSDRYMPRIASQFDADPRRMPFDFHEVLAAIAPRPIFVSAPSRDSNFDNIGVREVVQRTQPVYELFAKGSLVATYPDAAHDFPEDVREAAYTWLAKCLQ